MSRTTFFAIFLFVLALGCWGAYGYAILELGAERGAYATLLSEGEMKETRERAVARLRSSVRDTRDEREAIEDLTEVDVIQAVSTIEAVGEATRSVVKIDGATESASEHVRTIAVSVTMQGGLSALLDALTILETLPFPALVENVDLVSDTAQKDAWTARLRMKVITTSDLGV